MSESVDEIEEGIVEERVFTIPLRRAWISPVKKRAPKAIKIIRDYLRKHMKSDTISISTEVNKKVWNRGIEKPPRKIKIRATKDEDGVVRAHLVKGE
jgi:large subunit ribosomal protein L31e